MALVNFIPSNCTLQAQAKNLAAIKAADNGGKVDGAKGGKRAQAFKWCGPRSCIFADVPLRDLNIPKEAWPLKNHDYEGKKGYTIYSKNGAVTCFHKVKEYLFQVAPQEVCLFFSRNHASTSALPQSCPYQGDRSASLHQGLWHQAVDS